MRISIIVCLCVKNWFSRINSKQLTNISSKRTELSNRTQSDEWKMDTKRLFFSIDCSVVFVENIDLKYPGWHIFSFLIPIPDVISKPFWLGLKREDFEPLPNNLRK